MTNEEIRKLSDDPQTDDVEGHKLAVDPQAGEDDVEGHKLAVDPQAGEDDVEGHRLPTH